MNNSKCLCNCKCANPWKVMKAYDHIKEVDEQFRRFEFTLKEMKHYPDAPWYAARPFESGRHSIDQMLFHLKEIRDKYAKSLGMDEQ